MEVPNGGDVVVNGMAEEPSSEMSDKKCEGNETLCKIVDNKEDQEKKSDSKDIESDPKKSESSESSKSSPQPDDTTTMGLVNGKSNEKKEDRQEEGKVDPKPQNAAVDKISDAAVNELNHVKSDAASNELNHVQSNTASKEPNHVKSDAVSNKLNNKKIDASSNKLNNVNSDAASNAPSHQDLLKALKTEKTNGDVNDLDDEYEDEPMERDVKEKVAKPTIGKKTGRKRRKKTMSVSVKPLKSKRAYPKHQPWLYTKRNRKAKTKDNCDDDEDDDDGEVTLKLVVNGTGECDKPGNSSKDNEDTVSMDAAGDGVTPSIECRSIADSEGSQSTIFGDYGQIAESEPLENKVGVKIKLGGHIKKDEDESPKKRGPGRPKGVKNKSTIIAMRKKNLAYAPDSPTMDRRGRKSPKTHQKSSLSRRQMAHVRNIRKNLSRARETSSQSPQYEDVTENNKMDTTDVVRERSLSPPVLERNEPVCANSTNGVQDVSPANSKDSRRSRSRSAVKDISPTEVKLEIMDASYSAHDNPPNISPAPDRKRARKSFEQGVVSSQLTTEETPTKTKERTARKTMNKHRRSKDAPSDNTQKSILNYFKGDNNEASSKAENNVVNDEKEKKITQEGKEKKVTQEGKAKDKNAPAAKRVSAVPEITSSTVSDATERRDPSPSKLQVQRARKSFNPRSLSGSPMRHATPAPRSPSPTDSNASSQPVGQFNMKISAIERIVGHSIDTLSAKNFDKILLERQRGKSEPLSDSCLADDTGEEEDFEEWNEDEEETLEEFHSSSMASTVIAGQNILKKKRRRKYKGGIYKLPGERGSRERKANSAAHSAVDRVKRMYRKRSRSQESVVSAGTSSLRSSTRSSISKTVAYETNSNGSEAVTEDYLTAPQDLAAVDTLTTQDMIQVDSIEQVPTHDIDFDTVVYTPKPAKLRVIGTIRQRRLSDNLSISPAKPSALFKQPWNHRVALSDRENLFSRFSPSGDWLSTVNGNANAENYGEQEAYYDQARRSFRKRKVPSDENFVYLPEHDGISTEMIIDDHHAQVGGGYNKRARYAAAASSSSHRALSKEEAEEMFLVHGGEASLPTLGEEGTQAYNKPTHVRQLDPAFDSRYSSFHNKKKKANLKFVITPNGVMYPVTPPSTPETRGASPEDASNGEASESGGRREEGLLPVCTCSLPGITVPNQHKGTFCQALDYLDGKVLGCSKKVNGNQLFRPAVKIPFMALCETHKRRLKVHQCCAGCGQFCVKGKFVQCFGEEESSSSTVTNGTPAAPTLHIFHKRCMLMRDNKYHCPHCAAETTQEEKYLAVTDPTTLQALSSSSSSLLPSFMGKKEGTTGSTSLNARMSATRPLKSSTSSSVLLPSSAASTTSSTSRPSSPRPSSPNGSVASGKESLSLKIADREINFDNLPNGVERKALVMALSLVQGEDVPKRLKVGSKSLYQACKANDLEKVIYLLSDGADPNQQWEEHGKQTCLHVAAEEGNFNIAYFLLQAGANAHCIDESLRTPLLEAAAEGHLKVLNLLNKSGAVADFKAEDGMTALHVSAQSGHCSLVQYLVEVAGVPLNTQDDGGWTAMVWAAEHRHLDCVRYLLAKGTDPNIRDNEDNTCLHWAAFAGSVDIAEMCLDAGCDLEAANEHGDRPLHIAARQGHYKCVALFLARGADSESRNNANNAAIACCVDQSSSTWMALRVNRQLKSIAAVQQHTQPERLVHRDISMGRETHPISVVNGVDQESYPQDFLYVASSIETSPMNVNTALSSLQHCRCRDNCTSVFCACGRSSVRCWYTKDGRLSEEFNYLDPPLVFECNKACRCWATCANRVVQLGITVRLQAFKTKGRGWGARTLLDIKKGTYVCEYVGELISDAEADSREDDSYLFDLDNKIEDTFCIDARQYGNIARFINHLCEPNVIPVKVFIDHQDLRFPRICFFASRDIKAGEELGFDYGDKFWIIKWKQFTCECGSVKCRYNKNTIHKTIEDFNARNADEEPTDEPPFM